MKTLSWKASLILLFGLACFAIGQRPSRECNELLGILKEQDEAIANYKLAVQSFELALTKCEDQKKASNPKATQRTVSGGLLIDASPSPIAFRMQSESKEILTISREGKLTIADGLTMDEAAKEFIIVLEKQFGRQLVDLQTPCSPKIFKE